MKIHILEESQTRIKFEVESSDNLNMICNTLNLELWKDPGVTVAGFHQEHPLINKLTFLVETKKGTAPRAALEEALQRIQKQTDEFGKKAVKVL